MAERFRRVAVLAAIAWCVQGALAAVAVTDADRLRTVHEKVMQAHRQSNVELLLEDEAADYVVANRGEVSRPTLDERRRRLGTYLSRASFKEYRDLVEPVVTVSNDGTLAWVVVQVQARGTNPLNSSAPGSSLIERRTAGGGGWGTFRTSGRSEGGESWL